MHPSQRPRSGQHARVSLHARNVDSFAFFNLLTGPQLLDRVEAQLPAHVSAQIISPLNSHVFSRLIRWEFPV